MHKLKYKNIYKKYNSLGGGTHYQIRDRKMRRKEKEVPKTLELYHNYYDYFVFKFSYNKDLVEEMHTLECSYNPESTNWSLQVKSDNIAAVKWFCIENGFNIDVFDDL